MSNKNPGRFQDLVGQKFGKLTVMSLAFRTPRGQVMWNTVCECGGVNVVITANLKNGHTKSCGCLRNLHPGPRVTGRKYWLPEGEAAFNILLSQYKRGAASREYSFELTRDEFRQLVTANCHYCNAAPSRLAVSKNKENQRFYNGNFIYSGIDRKINSKGYTLDNSISCCTTCNLAKHDMSYEQFLDYLDNLTQFRSRVS